MKLIQILSNIFCLKSKIKLGILKEEEDNFKLIDKIDWLYEKGELTEFGYLSLKNEIIY
jgi:hypothetical protein